MTKPLLRIGTRGSPMALVQAETVRDRLAAAHPELAAPGALEIVVIRTTGDKIQDRTLAAIGGKGLFTKEIEEGLLDRSIDLAVHSMKDVATWLPAGLEIVCLLERDDPRDAFLSARAKTLAELPAGAVVGTASLRRQAQILKARPDLRVQPIRGNAGTRMRKLAAGECDATLLALAGLQRLKQTEVIASILSVEEMLPAVAQGAIGIECRADDARTRDFLAPLNHGPTATCIAAERALLAALDGSCKTPIAALATLQGSEVALQALVIRPDGSESHAAERRGAAADAAALGTDAGAELKGKAGPGFFQAG
ncbi:MAG: hydroxymethylbilane synthase [Alphaproteobacteria bacterium]|nr:hydroxymethylbilane synthase [Alphaproteobacteria bacterium]